jgi:hypothetical protein
MAKIHTEDNLRKASDHLFYEIWMINRIALILESQSNSMPGTTSTAYTHTTETTVLLRSTGTFRVDVEEDDTRLIRNNALIEAFGMHTRSLLDFFYTNAEHDDVIASHFFSPPSIWENARPFKSKEELKEIKDRINKEIAHLTYTRNDVKSKLWPFKEIQTDLNKIVEVFLSRVSKNLLGSRWE